MSKRIACASMLGLLIGGGALAAPAPKPIIGGVTARQDAAVVGLATDTGVVYCTGTIVSPRIVVTAAHCLEGLPPPAQVFVGQDPAHDGVFVEVADVSVHPDHDPVSKTADLGVVVLARALPIAPIALVESQDQASYAGQVARFVGFGSTSDTPGSDVGVKYVASAVLESVDEQWVSYGSVSCHGDSGGPVFVRHGNAEQLAGVISHGSPACDGKGYAVHVASYRAWIEERIATLDPPICAFDTRCASGCASLDPDCVVPVPVTVYEPPTSTGCTAGDTPGPAATLVLVLLFALRRRRRVAIPAISLLCLAAGCVAELSPPSYRRFCRERPIGDIDAPIALELLSRDAWGTVAPVQETGVAPLSLSTGESGIALTIRATNLDGCAVAVSVRLESLGLPERRTGMLVELDEHGEVDPGNPLHFVELVTVADRDHAATVVVEDALGHWAATSIVIPRRF
jgi:MYXO-CTERM domain-containing protein